jgi:hypothetical protein
LILLKILDPGCALIARAAWRVTKLLQVAGKTMKSQKTCVFAARWRTLSAVPTLPKKSEKRVAPATYFNVVAVCRAATAKIAQR